MTLDGDVDFEPKAVNLLLDRMKKSYEVGAACGRIHPIGSGNYFCKFPGMSPGIIWCEKPIVRRITK